MNLIEFLNLKSLTNYTEATISMLIFYEIFMRLIFMGSPDFSVTALKALRQAGHTIVAVYCQPPRSKDRGHQLQKGVVHQAAEEMP